MHFVYIFDLDDTLMPTSTLFTQPMAQYFLGRMNRSDLASMELTYRRVIPQDPVLIQSLMALTGPKLLFTNGSRAHGYFSMQALGISSLFMGQFDANSSDALKPHEKVYALVEHFVEQHPTISSGVFQPLVFFDDQVVNLKTAKTRGWITVWICNGSNMPVEKWNFIDFTFTNIHHALHFFQQLEQKTR